MSSTADGLPSSGESIPTDRPLRMSLKTAWTTSRRLRMSSWGITSLLSRVPAPSTAPSKLPCSAGSPSCCGSSSAASSLAPCMTSARCSRRFATRARRSPLSLPKTSTAAPSASSAYSRISSSSSSSRLLPRSSRTPSRRPPQSPASPTSRRRPSRFCSCSPPSSGAWPRVAASSPRCSTSALRSS